MVPFDDAVDCSPVVWQVVLILDSPGSHDGCFCLSLTILSSTLFAMELVPLLGPGLLGASCCVPFVLYVLTHLQRVLIDISSTDEISSACLTPSM